MAPPDHVQRSVHPRRPPAHRSVSLLHSPKRKANVIVPTTTTTANRKTSPLNQSEGTDGSPSSLQPNGGKASSGESSSTAEKWFEKSNNHVRDTSTSFADNEPPYFLRNTSSSSDNSPHVGQSRKPKQYLSPNDGTSSLPLQAALLHIGTDGSSTDDFRGVIDDLTIENKKLKRRLKKYEKLHDSHLKDEKLFEVRVHGLPPEKKRELEETLRKFAAGLQQPGFPSNGYDGLLPMIKTHNTSSSQTSIHNTDSAYASMSASGQGSSAHSATETKPKKAMHAAARHHNIHTYLHQIPEGLLPQSISSNMTERAKKKLVVRRLEQIFSGKGAALDGHQQPIQQQEVSQSAALAEQSAREALGQRTRQEGNREAHIMRSELGDGLGGKDSHENQDDSPDNDAAELRPARRMGDARDFSDSSPKHGTEQRPTRPLDLDPQRAQIPAENLRYMRHLGFSPLDLESMQPLQEGRGWIYLNLLINMAQLHTINVTSDFVRKAVSELSDKFELSQDGRKLRWKGRPLPPAGNSSETGSGSAGDWTSEHTSADRSPRKRPKLAHRNHSALSARSGLGQGSASLQKARVENNKLVYTPLFFHKDSTDEADDSSSEDDDDDSSPYPAPIGGDSSGMTSSGVRTVSTKKNKKHDDGPIIFYNNARFCTDLSGERDAKGNPNAPAYAVASVQPLGKPRPANIGILEKRGPLEQASELPEPMDLSDNPIPESLELSFPPSSPSSTTSSKPANALPIDLEVTGIGGVWPSDHFAIRVQSRHALVPSESAMTRPSSAAGTKHVPPKIAELLHQDERKKRQPTPTIDKKVVSSIRQDLAPSQLPPALSFMRFGEDSISDDDESNADDDESVMPESPGAFPPSTAPQMMDMPDRSDSEDEEGDEDGESESSGEGSSEGSLDLLASARQVDPEAIRAREREYDANMAERLAEEIPAGSSAATAGGGSGFASPVSRMGQDEYQRAVRDARGRVAKRGRNNEKSQKVYDVSDDTRVEVDGDEGADSSESDDDMNDVSS